MQSDKNFDSPVFYLRFKPIELKRRVYDAAEYKGVSMNTYINDVLKRSVERTKGR